MAVYIPDWMMAAGVFVLFIILSFVAAFILKKLAHLTKKTKTNLDDKIMGALKNPIRWLLVSIGLFLALDWLFPGIVYGGYTLVQGFTIIWVLITTYVVANVIKVVFQWYGEMAARKAHVRVDKTIFKFLRRIVVAVVYAIALLIILDHLGIKITPLLAGLGIAGLAVALALQDTLANFFASIYITADRPIKVGDYIEVNGKKGYVEDIGWRSTKIRTLPNNLIIIPNNELANSVIENFSAPKPEMSVVITVGVSYNSDLEKVERVTIKVAKKILKKVPGAVKDFVPLIRYKEFADSSINFSVILRVSEFASKYPITHEFIKELYKEYKKQKIEIPFPQIDIHMKKR